MTNTNQNKTFRVREGFPGQSTKLTVDHLGRNLITFVHPSYGRDTYANVGLQIEQADLIRPTMSQITSLAHASCNTNYPIEGRLTTEEERQERYAKEIKQMMWDALNLGFTGSHYVPNKGAYIQDDPQIRNGMPFMEESELVRKLEANDPSVRFVPFGFRVGKMTPAQLAENEYIRGLVGDEGAEKLAEMASKHRNDPVLYSFESVNEPSTRVSALRFDSFIGNLVVNGAAPGDFKYFCSYGVL